MKCKNYYKLFLKWCSKNYVPVNNDFISCNYFGNLSCLDNDCWLCMKHKPYQWHMCNDYIWLNNLLLSQGEFTKLTKEDAINIINKTKRKHIFNSRKHQMKKYLKHKMWR